MSPETRCKHGFLRSVVSCPVCDGDRRPKRSAGDGYYEPSQRRVRGYCDAITTKGEAQCIGCGEVKPLSEFYKSRNRSNGRQSRCKVCDNDKSAKRRHGGLLTA